MRPSILQREESISVDRNIVTLLSRATYESFPRVLRELVSNAYDADASRVSIDIYIDRDEIVVEDNGNGMTPNQFHYFLTIAARKRTPAPTPRYKRERIGQFGVGFLAAFPFCEELVVQTSAERSPITITATIPSNRYLRDRREDIEGIESIRVPVTEATDPRQTDKRFTRITLSGLTHLAQEYLSPDKSGRREMSPKEQLKWDLQDTLVLDYPPRSPIATALDQRPVGMEVYLDGEQLFRNEPPGEVLETHSTSGLDLRTLEAAGLGVPLRDH